MGLTKCQKLLGQFQKLLGQQIHAFGPDSHGCWGRHQKVQTYTIKDIWHRNDYLLVYLDGYNADTHGLIYTCQVFEKELRAMIRRAKIKAELSYSEQGMQGDDYVHFDFVLV